MKMKAALKISLIAMAIGFAVGLAGLLAGGQNRTITVGNITVDHCSITIGSRPESTPMAPAAPQGAKSANPAQSARGDKK